MWTCRAILLRFINKGRCRTDQDRARHRARSRCWSPILTVSRGPVPAYRTEVDAGGAGGTRRRTGRSHAGALPQRVEGRRVHFRELGRARACGRHEPNACCSETRRGIFWTDPRTTASRPPPNCSTRRRDRSRGVVWHSQRCFATRRYSFFLGISDPYGRFIPFVGRNTTIRKARRGHFKLTEKEVIIRIRDRNFTEKLKKPRYLSFRSLRR